MTRCPAVMPAREVRTLCKQTEKAFQRQVIELARLHRWRTAHFRPAMTAKGWRTPVSGDGKGFLDLVLVREQVLWVECKTDTGKMTAEQKDWADALEAAGQRVCIWRPRDWSLIVEVLT